MIKCKYYIGSLCQSPISVRFLVHYRRTVWKIRLTGCINSPTQIHIGYILRSRLSHDLFVCRTWEFDDLATKQIYCCGIVRPNRKGTPQDLGPKGMTWGDLQVRTRGDLTAIMWRDKRDVRILTNIHDPPAEGNFCNNNGKTIKPQIVADYNRHMGYVDKGDRMANSYFINRRTWKWTKKLFFHLFDLAILNSYILFPSLGVRKFRTAIFGTPYWGIRWHTLDMNGMCKGQ